MSIWLQENSVPRADEKRKPALRHVRLRKSVFSCHRRAKTLHGLIWGSSALFRKKCLNSRGILAVFSPNLTYLLKNPNRFIMPWAWRRFIQRFLKIFPATQKYKLYHKIYEFSGCRMPYGFHKQQPFPLTCARWHFIFLIKSFAYWFLIKCRVKFIITFVLVTFIFKMQVYLKA